MYSGRFLILYCLQARISAVNGEDCAGRERGRAACKIEHQSDHFVRLGDSSHRRTADPLRNRRVVRRRKPSGRERRIREAGADRVDAHAALRPLVGHALRQHDDARLGRVVRALLLWQWVHDQAGHGRDVHNIAVSLLQHPVPERAAHEERAR